MPPVEGVQVSEAINEFLADRGLRIGMVEVVLRQSAAQHLAVDVFHDEEGGAEWRAVVAGGQHLWHRDCAAVQGPDDACLAHYVVRAAGDRYLRCPADDPARTQARHAKELAGRAAADGFDGELRFLPGLSGQPTAEGAGIEIHVVHSRVPGAASVMAF